MRRARRTGFTLFELLILLVLLLIVAALLLPAVQRVREAANKMLCGSNLRQSAIACHNYHNDFDRLPPGYWGPLGKEEPLGDGKKSQNVSVQLALLPYLEGDNLFRQLRTTQGLGDNAVPAGQAGFDFSLETASAPWWTSEVDLSLAAAKLKLFLCPSQDATESPARGYVMAIHIVGSDRKAIFNTTPMDLGRTHYAGVAGCLGKYAPKNTGTINDDYSKYEGLLGNRSKLTLGQITALDGTSNTLMLGEGLGGDLKRGKQDTAWTWIGVGGMWTYFGLQPTKAPVDADTGCFRFGSPHRDGVQFAHGDASVRLVRWGRTAVIAKAGNDPTDWTLLQQLAGYKDGLSFDVSRILD